MALEISGKILKMMPEVTGQGKNGQWVKQEFVIETREQYPKKVCMSAWGDKVKELKKFSSGDDVQVAFNVESREYNERWYTDLRIWRIQGSAAASSQAADDPFYPDQEPPFVSDNTSDDLPF